MKDSVPLKGPKDGRKAVRITTGGRGPTKDASVSASGRARVPMVLARGARFGRYSIDSLLGQGGMAYVYRAHDTTGQAVALKILKPENLYDATGREFSDAVKRLVREGRAAMELRHPHIVTVYEVGEQDQAPFLAMELVEGRPLAAYLGDVSITFSQRIQWLSSLADCLAHAHAKGIVHRDVKPENVIIAKDGTARLTDFGIAKRLFDEDRGGGSVVTKIGTVVGTPMYMAPEQSIGDPADARSDQFSWSTMAYELLSNGTHPVHTNNPKKLPFEFAVLQERPKPLKELAPELPDAIASVIMKGLAKMPGDRNLDMNVVASALQHFIPTTGETPAVPEKKTPSPARVLSARALPDEERRRIPIVEQGRPDGREPTWAFWLVMVAIGLATALLAFELSRAIGRRNHGPVQAQE